ncbi:aminodeoxychorismate synthase component I [Pseudomonas guariconensis]|uniref:aminodeoxychorismate synthase component I n=1 Tax=Pseudomonas guariconensis TaxID=1288410 RepID=UPI0018AC87A9|nr:aminodeoxychorismate synthase component I [Pseudomonas guariconensis]MBF8740975.1 aminodeoxychorismate synthase component I [Pseudomonas guariconensis]MBF8750329.1 aminodeoxychorismate synthase component I [Pseudomonas guariconensis]
MKILLIDNFDSFTQNIAQYLYEVTGGYVDVVTNAVPYNELKIENYDAVVLSPGPGHPGSNLDFGVCGDVVLQSTIPLLGICLGHQGIVQFLGGTIAHSPSPVHGYRSRITHTGKGLFRDLPEQFDVVRYHSLACTYLPDDLHCTAWTDDGVIMAIEHVNRPVWGVQFHPESIDSEYGHALLRNFVQMVQEYNSIHRSHLGGRVNLQSARDAFIDVGGMQNMQLTYREYPGQITPLALFSQCYANERYAFWLDSEKSERPNARYSIMGSGQAQGAIRLEYSVNHEHLTLEGPKGRLQVEGDCFTLMSQIIESVQLTIPQDLPFTFRGGFVGYLGYELKALVGGNKAYCSRYPDASFIFAPHFFVFDHYYQKLYECLISEVGQRLEWPQLPSVLLSKEQVSDEFQRFVPGAVDELELSLADSSENYIRKIEQSLQYITDGESYEICLTNRARMVYSGVPLDAYRRMREISPVPYGAYLKFDRFSILSASPETFLSIDDSGLIESRPIKGTRARGKDVDEDLRLRENLAASAKDRAENLMIVDLVRHDLNRVCRPGSVHVPEIFSVESFSSVHQLVSTVRGRLAPGVSTVEAIRACFPGGSMTGAPKKRTMEIIDVLESSARGVYSGALGWISFNGGAELSVVIRTAVVQNHEAEFGIGGAIVAHSDPQQEFEETLIKASVPYHSFIAGNEQ